MGSDQASAEDDISYLQSQIERIGELHPSVYKSQAGPKSMGLFTRDTITRGTLILAEYPISSVSDVSLLQQPWSDLDSADTWAMALQILKDDRISLTTDLHPRADATYPINSIPDSIRPLLKDHEPLLKRCDLNSIGYSTFPELIKHDHFESFSGTGLYSQSSLFNHSCDPNVYRYSLGPLLIFRAARDISPDCQLFISYIPTEILCEPRAVRSLFLGNRDFSCSCVRCQESESPENIEPLGFKIRAELRSLPTEERVENISDFLSQMEEERCYFSDYLDLKIMLAKDLRTRSAWQAARDYAREKIPIYDLIHCVLAFEIGDLDFVRNHLLEYYAISDVDRIFKTLID